MAKPEGALARPLSCFHLNNMDFPYFFTWTAQRAATPIAIRGGKGVWFETEEGLWLDFGSLSYQANLGHGSERMVRAIQRQCERLLLTLPNGIYPEKEALARALLEKAPSGFSKVFFTLGGAEAVENAVKIARLFTGRYKTISRYRSYHGATLGALALSGDYRRPPLEPLGPGAIHVLDCYVSRLPGGAQSIEGGGSADAIALTAKLEGPRSIAAIVVEPVPGQNGCLVPPPGYWDALRRIADAEGAVLIADCVLNGFGRLGTYYGFEAVGEAAPDIIVLSKALTGGYAPLGALLVHDRIARHFDDHVLYAGLTFYGHPLGVGAALEAVRIYEEEGLIQRASELAKPFASLLHAFQDRWPELVPKTRAIGLLGAFELNMKQEAFERFVKSLRAERIHLHINHGFRTVILAPPLVIHAHELEEGFARIERALLASVQ
ncbi:MAG: aminotransferase class III-fold pyridoxal phosphate-dependent enzyme [Sandaracinaceae bacterium]|nr:aminotransferase class III-fold pyridoxal phosphate-dependent enzyme [Sandaracinaceae bacterium]